VIIDRLPPFVQRFFSPMEAALSKPQYRHLWSLVLAVVVTLRASKLVHLSGAAPRAGHRTSKGSFLSDSDWDAPALVDRAAAGLLAAMRPRPGEVAYLILDDNRIPKKGKRMDWVSKLWDHKQQRFVRGHIALTAAVLFRGVVLPWRVELWKPKGHPGQPRYRKLTDMAADMVKAFAPPAGVKVRVLFDAFYLCPQVAKACQAKGFTFFSVAARNRSFAADRKGGKAKAKGKKIGRLMPGLIRYRGTNVRMKRTRGRVAGLRIARADGHLSRIGRVRMVVSKRPRGPWKKCVAIVTNETGLKPRRIVAIYELRWSIEVLFKELHQDLGLGDYQMLHKDGIVHHLHVCCLAHLMLTHQSLAGLGAKARKPNTTVPLPRMSQRLADLRRLIAEDQIERLIPGDEHANLRKKLHDYLLDQSDQRAAA
jgi:SRSO17 transposase